MTDVKDSAALTLMGSDVERIVQGLRLIHELWAAVPEMAVAVWLLSRQMSWACVFPMVVSLGAFSTFSLSTYHFSIIFLEIRTRCLIALANNGGQLRLLEHLLLPSALDRLRRHGMNECKSEWP